MSFALSTWQNGAEIAAWLDLGVLFTHVAELWSGEEVTTKITERRGRDPLTAAEHRHLETWRDGTAAGWRREGLLVTASGTRAAVITAVYLPSRIPDRDVIERLQCTDMPLGRALHGLGVHRRCLSSDMRACVPFAVESAGVLVLPASLGGLPVALATEQVYRSFASRRGSDEGAVREDAAPEAVTAG